MNPSKTIVFAALAVSHLSAQHVAFETATAAATVGTSLTGTQGDSDFISPGTQPGFASLDAFAFGSVPGEYAQANLAWSQGPPTAQGALTFVYEANVAANAVTAPASAEIQPHEIVVMLTAATPRAVLLDAELLASSTAGQPVPRLEVDVLDDGSVEYSLLSSFPTLPQNLVIGPNPTPIRIRGDFRVTTAAGQSAQVDIDLTLTVLPNNGLQITPQAVGCSNEGAACVPSFAHDGISVQHQGTGLQFAVLGLAQQPILLPNSPGCVLLPRPDIVVPILPFAPYELPIPAAVRPITVHVQGVLPGPNSLWTSRAYRIDAF